MSLSLLQGYSSAEEEAEDDAGQLRNSSDDEDGDESGRPVRSYSSLPEATRPSRESGLPSAFDAFSEISGPPEFLNNSVQEQPSGADGDQQMWRHGRRRNRRDKKDLPSGAVMEAKPQLVGIHERVRSDVDGGTGTQLPTPSIPKEGKRVATATNPNAEDAAELLRMCLQCGIPKTYSNARGMVCPMCGDRPKTDTSSEPKKKGSTIKDKEKSKRMKGQSSHANWKSETEMQLRQQFD
ncbi:uncharacterized protein LOC116194235 [Punica granatum]|uniref:Uncharacterized protein n=2 Tax=Punica granatum TaxID=22663 RepID=A0A218VTD5_PUNGR|nr:uncharacterized protein LOC116194235 [Punica granatum]OWM63593.1 hypothetical protein CDL15_Pgr008136 [Punica granatum]PKI37834.1 hypothetical protein CRG98_041784 [Punica granatum]